MEQEQSINEELKNKYLGNEKSKNSSSSDIKSKNLWLQFIKDFYYICFGFAKDIILGLFKIFSSSNTKKSKQQPVHLITENKSKKSLSANNQAVSDSDSNTQSKTMNANPSSHLQQNAFSATACNDNDQSANNQAVSDSDSNTQSKTMNANPSSHLQQNAFSATACNDNDHNIDNDQTIAKISL